MARARQRPFPGKPMAQSSGPLTCTAGHTGGSEAAAAAPGRT